MTKKDIAEIKRQFKKLENCSIDRITGCYVNAEKEKVSTFNETFLNMDEEESLKYLEVARKTLSGKYGDAQIFAPIADDGRKKSLTQLVRGRFKERDQVEAFFDQVINHYSYAGNYLILLFHDNYDVITKGLDGESQGESEYVHEYILCAICPVDLSKPGLGYIEDANRIGKRIRDWVVGAPVNGFIYPAFTDRYTDDDHVLFYCKNPKDPHEELLTDVLYAEQVMSASIYHDLLKHAVDEALDADADAEYAYADVQSAMEDYVMDLKGGELHKSDIRQVAVDAGFREDQADQVASDFMDASGKECVPGELLIDEKALKEAEKQAELRTLKETVKDLTKKNQKMQEAVGKQPDLKALRTRILDAAEEHGDDYLLPKAALATIFAEYL